MELQSGSGSANSRRFGGEVGYDRDRPNWTNNGNRPYDAVNGRWLTPDEIGFGGDDWNLKRYVWNNPVVLFDPTGAQGQRKGPPFPGECTDAWPWVHFWCDQKCSCEGLVPPRDCGQIMARFVAGVNCYNARLRRDKACRFYDPIHEEQRRRYLKNATDCFGKMGGCVGPVPPIPIWEPVDQPQPWPVPVVQPGGHPIHVKIPNWVWVMLACGGIAALIAFCAINIEFAWICPLVIPQLKQALPQHL